MSAIMPFKGDDDYFCLSTMRLHFLVEEETMSGASTVTPGARVIRGLLVAVCATFFAGASHAVAGGQVPVVAAGVAVVFASLVCVVLAGRRLSLPRTVAGVTLSQVLFHSLFSVFAHGSPMIAGSSSGHRHELIFPAPMVAMPGPDHSGILMMVSHIAAGVLTVALVRHGEALWWSLVDILTASLSAVLQWAASCPVSNRLRSLPTRPAALGLYELLHADARRCLRGPPGTALSLA